MIVGIGIDLVGLDRFAAMMQKSPGLGDRIFTAAERDQPLQTLAGTFAAKEAVAKALGVPGGVEWLDVEVTHESDGRPVLAVGGSAAADLIWHLSISHDGGMAVAMVVAER